MLLNTGGVKSGSVVSALQVLGMTPVATGTKKSTEEDTARIRELIGEEALMLDDVSPKKLLQGVKDYRCDILRQARGLPPVARVLTPAGLRAEPRPGDR